MPTATIEEPQVEEAVEPSYCLCGCGKETVRPKSRYFPSHDSKHKARLVTAVLDGDEAEQAAAWDEIRSGVLSVRLREQVEHSIELRTAKRKQAAERQAEREQARKEAKEAKEARKAAAAQAEQSTDEGETETEDEGDKPKPRRRTTRARKG